jgi:DNA ligase-1
VVRKTQESNYMVSKVLRPVPILNITDNKEIWNWHFEQMCRKYGGRGEGVILKKYNAPYTYGKKNADVLKIKCENSFELLVVGVLEGEGKYKGTLGKLVVEDANGIRNNVSGMSDAERELWWNYQSEIKGKIVQVDCMKVLSNKSLREGRFKAIRHDKTEVDKL